MLEREFMELTGMSSSEANEEYVIANGMYMSTNLDKEPFCKEYMKMKKGGNVLAQEFYAYLTRKERELVELQNKYNALKALTESVANDRDEAQVRHEQEMDAMQRTHESNIAKMKVEAGHYLCDLLALTKSDSIREEIRKQAIEALGPKAYLRRMLVNGQTLTQKDNDLLLDALGEDE